MKKNVFLEGLRDGLPIGLGYFAVAFSLGIVAQNAGLDALQGFIASFFNVASAGEYALFTSIAAKATYVEIAVITLVVNARYLLMSCALSQRFDEHTPMIHRFFVGFGVTDEIFGITIGREGNINPIYNYGAIAIAVPLWSLGTSLGIMAGNFLPENSKKLSQIIKRRRIKWSVILPKSPPNSRSWPLRASAHTALILSYIRNIMLNAVFAT